jgi:hypothetical protein
VLEENRRLRALLRDRGISDGEIDAYDKVLSDAPTTSNAADALDFMLKSRKMCNIQTPTSATTATTPWTPKDAQIIAAPTPQRPLIIPHQRTVELQQGGSPVPSSPHLTMSPVSAAESVSSYSHYPATPSDDASEPGTFPHLSYQYDPTPNSPWPMPASTMDQQPPVIDYNCTTSSVYSANVIATMRSDIGYDMDHTGVPVTTGMVYSYASQP